MLDITGILTREFVDRLRSGYRDAFHGRAPDHEKQIVENAEQIIQLISGSNTLYHNIEHTIQVTLVGQTVLQGKMTVDTSITPELWLNFIMALLCHDIGYVAGICHTDQQTSESNASDAVFMSAHIERGKQFVRDFFSTQPGIDSDFIQDCIERTRFPVPEDPTYQRTDDYPGLVRGADLIGQLSDPRYIHKLPAVFFEFEESGYNEVTGYKQPGDLLESYADFYQRSVMPYVGETLEYLAMTTMGKTIIDSLEANTHRARENSDRNCSQLSVGSRHF